MSSDAELALLARKYGETWEAFDRAADKAEQNHGARGDWNEATKDALRALAHERFAAHAALLRALGIAT